MPAYTWKFIPSISSNFQTIYLQPIDLEAYILEFLIGKQDEAVGEMNHPPKKNEW